MSDEEVVWGDPEKFHQSEEVWGNDLTIQFFIEESFKATEKGCTHWGTLTDRRGRSPWKCRLIFYKPLEEEE